MCMTASFRDGRCHAPFGFVGKTREDDVGAPFCRHKIILVASMGARLLVGTRLCSSADGRRGGVRFNFLMRVLVVGEIGEDSEFCVLVPAQCAFHQIRTRCSHAEVNPFTNPKGHQIQPGFLSSADLTSHIRETSHSPAKSAGRRPAAMVSRRSA